MDDFKELLTRGVAEVITPEELTEKLKSGKTLRLKQGFDPSRANLHIGHAVGLRKLRQLQELGHKVVLIVGDWTAQIGDPSGRDESRIKISAGEVKENAETYMQQFFQIVDRRKTEVHYQSEWFKDFDLAAVFDLTSRFTLAQLMAHETFRKRYEENRPLSMMELMYPLLQAYDSVAIDADVEFGGTDQKFNILAGRELQTMLGKPPQNVFLVPLLPGADGRKMSKSFDNTIDLTEPPNEVYGKIMSIADAVLLTYFELTTDVPMGEIREMELAMKTGEVNPRDFKMRLARELTTLLHDKDAALAAEAEFVKVFQKRELPTEIPNFDLRESKNIVDLISDARLVASKSEARRLIEQGGVKINDEKIDSIDFMVEPKDGDVIKIGKRRFLRIVNK